MNELFTLIEPVEPPLVAARQAYAAAKAAVEKNLDPDKFSNLHEELRITHMNLVFAEWREFFNIWGRTMTHGPGICEYCGARNVILKTDPRLQKSYCRKCAPGRETDTDWQNVPAETREA